MMMAPDMNSDYPNYISFRFRISKLKLYFRIFLEKNLFSLIYTVGTQCLSQLAITTLYLFSEKSAFSGEFLWAHLVTFFWVCFLELLWWWFSASVFSLSPINKQKKFSVWCFSLCPLFNRNYFFHFFSV